MAHQTGLNGLIDRLNQHIASDLTKTAAVAKKKKCAESNISDSDVNSILGGNRAELSLGGEPHSMDDTELKDSQYTDGDPTDEYDPNKDADKLLEEDRLAEAMAVGEQAGTTVEKAARLAEVILTNYDKEVTNDSYSISKKAGMEDFNKLLTEKGAEFLFKVAADIDPEIQYNQGMFLADFAIKQASAKIQNDEILYKTGADLAYNAIKQAQAQVTATTTPDQEKRAYDLGKYLAESTIKKIAADLVAIRPVLQDLVSNGVLSSDERDSLVSILAGQDVLSPDGVFEATKNVANADAVAAALIKALEGTQGANVVPPYSNVPLPTPEAIPSGQTTADQMTGSVEDKAEELLDMAISPEEKEQELVIQAALNVLKKKNRRRK